jgi:hypothetical protein
LATIGLACGVVNILYIDKNSNFSHFFTIGSWLVKHHNLQQG